MPLSIRGVLRRKIDRSETRILDLLLKHAEACMESVMALHNAISHLLERDLEEFEIWLKEVHKNEEKADDIKRKIFEDLARGVIPPLSREDFVRVVERMDMIADSARDGARVLEIPNTQKGILEHSESRILLKMIERARLCVETIRCAIKRISDDFEASLKLIHKVEEIEENMDALYVEGLATLCSGERSIRHSVLLERLIETLESICDYSEDVGDVLKIIIVRAIR